MTSTSPIRNPNCWPSHADYLKAKSANNGGDTLAKHTWDVLARLADLRDLRPDLPVMAASPRVWPNLFWTCLLHDFGKAAQGFQTMLAGGDRWRERHEVLSLAFVDWIADGLNEDDLRAIVAAIASHHRDAAYIEETYDHATSSSVPDPLAPLLGDVSPQVVSDLWRWADECAGDWMRTLGFATAQAPTIVLMPHDKAVALVSQQGVARVRHWLKQYRRWVRDLKDETAHTLIVLPMLLRGLTTTADHMASAHLYDVPAPIQTDWQDLAQRILKPGDQPYPHQLVSAARSGRSTLLVAPTGSGKTEAALYWAVGDGSKPIPRIFYALPYQASMNAMFDRLRNEQKGFGDESVGLQHGRALQAMYARLIDQESNLQSGPNKGQVAMGAKWAQNLNTLNARPIKVFSPYQMLKALFQIRGFEATLTDYAQSAFIFDEIHAYEPERLALMLTLMKLLREHYQARFFIMSATFPKLIREKLFDALALTDADIIGADETVFRAFRRHRLHLLDGGLLENGTGPIVADVRAGKSVLVCANTVQRAQDVHDALLLAGLPAEQVMLIHGRYIIRDRTKREGEIQVRCGLDAPHQPFVLVATQVVEVSLNIDLDTIYTDPAPLEALLQRFGRVNRARKKGICPVYVYRQPTDGQGVYGRSKDRKDKAQDGHIVRVTLAELERHAGEEIDEAATGAWLDAIYADPILSREWEDAYRRTESNAIVVANTLRPFNSDEQAEAEFEKLFDNIEVLPVRFERQYVDLMMRGEFIEASQLFVGISSRRYQGFRSQGKIRAIETEDEKHGRDKWLIKLPYSDARGLLFDPSSEIDEGS